MKLQELSMIERSDFMKTQTCITEQDGVTVLILVVGLGHTGGLNSGRECNARSTGKSMSLMVRIFHFILKKTKKLKGNSMIIKRGALSVKYSGLPFCQFF